MLRLTRYGVGNSVGAAPEIELEKSVLIGVVNETTRWAIHGPDAFGEKLAFIYSEGELGSATAETTRREVLTLTKDGCLGIGNSEPEYAIDIVGTEKKGSIRMLNVGTEPTPQLIFQTDAAAYRLRCKHRFPLLCKQQLFHHLTLRTAQTATASSFIWEAMDTSVCSHLRIIALM